jgi:hypothetical protein
MNHTKFTLISIGVALSLFLAIILFIELGRRFGVRQSRKHGTDARIGVGAVDSVVYGLLALLIGFTFNGAAARFDDRRHLVIEQVSAMSTAWQRFDMLPAESQPAIRAGFLRYVDAVIATNGAPPASPEQKRARESAREAEDVVWNLAVAAVTDDGGERARMLVLPAINEVSDAVDAERMAQRLHPPILVWIMLAIAALAGALFAGYGMSTGSRRNWMYILGVAATIAIATFVILELESSRLGLIRIDNVDESLRLLRARMK